VRSTKNGIPAASATRHDGALHIDRERTGVAPRLSLAVLAREKIAGTKHRPLGRPDLARQIADVALNALIGAPAAVLTDDLRREDHVARLEMRREAAGDAKADEAFRLSDGGLNERCRALGVAGSDNDLEPGGARDFGLCGKPRGAQHRYQSAHAQPPAANFGR